MKGTAPRGRTVAEDDRVAERLRTDAKSRAENVMIVDLLRNDLSRVTRPGSVSVSDLFTVERYETVHQMTSTVMGELNRGLGYRQIFQALFPCGSVTGAPKIRAMRVIRELEPTPRGVYTGAIGYIAPDDQAVFSIAIRTLVMDRETLTMGTGGGIVWDSTPSSEYQECLTKAQFLTVSSPEFQLIETMCFDGYLRLLNYHLARLSRSSAYFGFCLDPDRVRRLLLRRTSCLDSGKVYKVRLTLHRNGHVDISTELVAEVHGNRRVMLSTSSVRSDDRFLYHKTTNRSLYDSEFARASESGYAEILYTNEQGFVVEGSRTNVFVRRGKKLATPPPGDGLLPGVYRQFLLDTRSDVVEDHISVDELRSSDAVYLSNAIMGLVPVDVEPSGKTLS
jgi:para-aminobenzoate synthetase/4-amino-4-deoxychorismate lyase